MKVLSFDPSTNSIGVCLIDTDTRLIFSTSVFRYSKKTSKGSAFNRETEAHTLCEKVKQWLTKYKVENPDVIVIEEAYLSFNRASGKDTLIWFNGYFSCFINSLFSMDSSRVHPITWKSSVVNNKHAGKEETEEACMIWMERNGFQFFSEEPTIDDTYDAIAIALWKIREIEPDRFLF